MIKRFLAIFVLISTLVTSFAVCADDAATINALYNPESRTLSLSGKGYGSFMITVAKKTVSEENEDITVGNMSADNLPLVFKQIEAGGAFSLSLTMPQNSAVGKYYVYLTGAGGNASASFIIIDLDDANEVIANLNAKQISKDESGFNQLLNSSAETLGIDKEDSHYAKNEEKICKFLYGTKYIEIMGFTSMYNKAHTLLRMCGEENSDILTIIEENSSKIDGVTADDVTEDDRLSEKAEGILFGMLYGGEFISYIDEDGDFSFKSAFEEMKALSAVKASEYWTQLQKAIVNDFKNNFSEMLSYDTYESVNDKDKVFEKMIGTPFTDKVSIQKAFEDAVEAVYEEENPKEEISRPVSSGGGGGGATTPRFETEDTNDLPKKEDEATQPGEFSDVKENHWSYKAVSKLSEMGVVSGFPDGTFLPDKAVTRAELTKMIMTFADELERGEVTDFYDVLKEDWYYTYISDAAAMGIIMGSDGRFSPNDIIKREDAAVIIYRVLSLGGKAPVAQRYFPDRKQISAYAKEAVEALGSIDIVKGNEEGNFMPQSSLSRAEAAQLIYNAFVVGR